MRYHWGLGIGHTYTYVLPAGGPATLDFPETLNNSDDSSGEPLPDDEDPELMDGEENEIRGDEGMDEDEDYIDVESEDEDEDYMDVDGSDKSEESDEPDDEAIEIDDMHASQSLD